MSSNMINVRSRLKSDSMNDFDMNADEIEPNCDDPEDFIDDITDEGNLCVLVAKIGRVRENRFLNAMVDDSILGCINIVSLSKTLHLHCFSPLS